MVFEPDGRTRNRLSGRSSSDDSSGRTPQTETCPARCRATSKAAGRKPFSVDLAALEGTAGSPRVALTPSSVGTAAHADTERVAGHRAGEWFKAWKFALEPKRTTGHRVATTGNPYRAAAQ